MKKLKLNFEELEKEFQTIDKKEMRIINGGYGDDGYPITYDQYGHPIITIGGTSSVWGGGGDNGSYNYQQDSHGRSYYVDNTGRTHYVMQGVFLDGAQSFISSLSNYAGMGYDAITKSGLYGTLVGAGYSIMDEVFDEWFDKYFLEGDYE